MAGTFPRNRYSAIARAAWHKRRNEQKRRIADGKAKAAVEAVDGLAVDVAPPPVTAGEPDRYCRRCEEPRDGDPCEVCDRHTVAVCLEK